MRYHLKFSFPLILLACSILVCCKRATSEETTASIAENSSTSAVSQTSMDFEQYDPKSTLVVPEHLVLRAKFPFIDIHNHQWSMEDQDLSELIEVMDKMNMAVMNNLSGKSGEQLKSSIENISKHYPTRFTLFANLNYSGFGSAEWTTDAIAKLQTDVSHGAKGLKIFEELGTRISDNSGKRVKVDDSRLDGIWATCGALDIPVLIHTAAPIAFWDSFDKNNERWLELATHPDRKRSDKDPAPFQTLIEEQHRMFKKHPNTKFIAAHFDWHANDLVKLGEFLDNIPNMYIETGAIIAELGRQPRAAKEFFIKYQDRILFGKDSWVPGEYITYFRVLETEDEYFPYHKKYHAFWPMYGMGLPDEVLIKVYYANAMKLLKGIDKNLFKEE